MGSYSSAVTGPASLAASVAETPVVVWGASSSALGDKNTYRMLSRIVPSDSYMAASMGKIIHEFGWRELAILAVDDLYGR